MKQSLPSCIDPYREDGVDLFHFSDFKHGGKDCRNRQGIGMGAAGNQRYMTTKLFLPQPCQGIWFLILDIYGGKLGFLNSHTITPAIPQRNICH